MGRVISPSTNAEVLALLMAMLGASTLIFWTLVRRWTRQRQWVAMREWGGEAGFKLSAPDAQQFTGPLRVPVDQRAEVEWCLRSETTRLIRLRTVSTPDAGTAHREITWNLLERRLEREWKPAGLRPAGARQSFLDSFSLSSFPMAGGTDRFVSFAVDSEAAALFPYSTARSLLPQDIGLLLHGHTMVLDFSDRPFDELEFDRMIALAEQLVLKLAG